MAVTPVMATSQRPGSMVVVRGQYKRSGGFYAYSVPSGTIGIKRHLLHTTHFDFKNALHDALQAGRALGHGRAPTSYKISGGRHQAILCDGCGPVSPKLLNDPLQTVFTCHERILITHPPHCVLCLYPGDGHPLYYKMLM